MTRQIRDITILANSGGIQFLFTDDSEPVTIPTPFYLADSDRQYVTGAPLVSLLLASTLLATHERLQALETDVADLKLKVNAVNPGAGSGANMKLPKQD